MRFDDMLKVGAAAILRHTDAGWELLSARRTEPPAVAGLWEFPGGKIEADESPQECIVRELREELGVDVTLLDQIVGPLQGYWPLSERIAFAIWICTIEQEPVILEDHDAIAWLGVDALRSVPWIPVDLPLVAEIERILRIANASGEFPRP